MPARQLLPAECRVLLFAHLGGLVAYGKDKSLTIYLGHTSPGKDNKSNWLPTPDGKYSLVGRVYGPEQAAMDGTWKLPEPEEVK